MGEHTYGTQFHEQGASPYPLDQRLLDISCNALPGERAGHLFSF